MTKIRGLFLGRASVRPFLKNLLEHPTREGKTDHEKIVLLPLLTGAAPRYGPGAGSPGQTVSDAASRRGPGVWEREEGCSSVKQITK